MARRSFTDFDAQLTLRLSNRTDVTSAIREQLIHDALYHTALMFEHPEIEGTTTGSQSIAAESFTAVATDILWPEFVRNTTDGYAMKLEGKESIENQAKRSGKPRRFHWWGNSFYTDALPTATTAYKIFYVKKVARISGSTESPLSEQYDMLILMWAHKMGLETVRDWDEADSIGKQIGMFVARMNLPIRKSKMNTYQASLRVRTK